MPPGPHRFVLPLLLLWASLLLLSPKASAGRAYFTGSNAERPTVRWLIGGGIALPLAFEFASYNSGGGISAGVEWPQSDYHSLLLRLDYDHLGQDMEGTALPPGTEAGAANLAVLRADVRLQREVGLGPMHNYGEAGLGLSYRSISDAFHFDEATYTYRRSTDQGVSGAFVFASGTAYQPEGAGAGFFLEGQFVFLTRSQSMNYLLLRVGVTFP